MNRYVPLTFHTRPLMDVPLREDQYHFTMKIKEEPNCDDEFIFKKKTAIYFPMPQPPVTLERCNCSSCYVRQNDLFMPISPPPPLLIHTDGDTYVKNLDSVGERKNSNIKVEEVDEGCELLCKDDQTSESSKYLENEKCTSVDENQENSSERTRKYKCSVCDRAFTWFGNFQKHVLTHGQPSTNDPFFPDELIAEEGCIIKDTNNTFRCKLCDKTFTRLSGLRTHIKMHNGQRPFKCADCSLAFTTNRALKMHKRIHSGERPFKCSQCDKKFTRKDELQAHTYLHKGEKPFKCQNCGAAFVRQGHLQRHMLTHAAEKPYKCKQCPKSFTQYRNLQTHMYKHTGERPYKCRFCGKGFTQHGTVQAHERTHTGTKPYACDRCDKRFITSSHLRWHVKKHHNK